MPISQTAGTLGSFGEGFPIGIINTSNGGGTGGGGTGGGGITPPASTPCKIMIISGTNKTMNLWLSQSLNYLISESNLQIDWGDGSPVQSYSGITTPTLATHVYPTTGVYIISVSGSGSFNAYRMGSGGDSVKIIDVLQWGNFEFANLNDFLNGSSIGATLTATDTPNLTKCTKMFSMFALTNFNGNISNWDVSNISDFSGVFYMCTKFNQPLNTWNMSNAITISQMFRGCYVFNQPLNNWNTSNVVDMAHTFESAYVFNQPLNNWNTSKVTNMTRMFQEAKVFNQDLSSWNTSKVTNMSSMFSYAQKFNGDVTTWDTSSVTNMSWMFGNQASGNPINTFSRSIGGWNTSNVTNMQGMFARCNFNQPITNWNVSKVTSMNGMFVDAPSFNNGRAAGVAHSDLNRTVSGGWRTNLVTDYRSMFASAISWNGDISEWCTPVTYPGISFDQGAVAWTLPNSRPVWGTCPIP